MNMLNNLVTKPAQIQLQVSPIPQITFEIANLISQILESISEKVSYDSLDQLRNAYKYHNYNYVDYDELATTFTYYYFLKNFWKSVLLFLQEPPANRCITSVLDLGSGSGASILAYLSVLDSIIEQDASKESHKIQVTLLDRSKVQLDLALWIISSITPHLKHIDIETIIKCADFHNWESEANLYDQVLLGHVLTENRNYLSQIMRKAVISTKPNGKIAIIERTNDSVWLSIEEEVSRTALQARIYDLNSETPNVSKQEEFIDYIPESRLYSKLMSIKFPTKKEYTETVRNYFFAWESKSIEMLNQVFSCSALYEDKPWQKPIQGLDEIREYWITNVLLQSEIETFIKHIHYCENVATLGWGATFEKNNRKVELDGLMIICFDKKTNLIECLKERYLSRKD